MKIRQQFCYCHPKQEFWESFAAIYYFFVPNFPKIRYVMRADKQTNRKADHNTSLTYRREVMRHRAARFGLVADKSAIHFKGGCWGCAYRVIL